jgi:hypothetical protein
MPLWCATMIGDTSNIVASGICGRAPASVPISLAQLVVASLYVLAMGRLL